MISNLPLLKKKITLYGTGKGVFGSSIGGVHVSSCHHKITRLKKLFGKERPKYAAALAGSVASGKRVGTSAEREETVANVAGGATATILRVAKLGPASRDGAADLWVELPVALGSRRIREIKALKVAENTARLR